MGPAIFTFSYFHIFTLILRSFCIYLRSTKFYLTVMPRQKIFRINLLLWCFFIIGSIAGIVVQITYHKFINNDTLAYINIAELYASGKFGLALNGCWSPLYSWIVAFFLLPGIPAIFTCYVLNFVSSGICVYFLMKISRRYLTNEWFYFFFNLFTILWILFYALSALTPDLLATSAGLWMLSLVMSERFYKSSKIAALAGLAGAVMYFGKSYNCVFVTGFFLLLSAFAATNRKRRDDGEYRSPLRSLIVFCDMDHTT